MPTVTRRDWRIALELALLMALALFLPLREAPKNVLCLAYAVTWLANRVRDGRWGGRLDIWDALMAGLFATGCLSALFGGIQRGDGNEWRATLDIVRYGLVFTLVRRAGYDEETRWRVLTVLVASCVAAELEAIWNWKVAGKRKALELFSVGHVNHSAIYMAICLGIAAGMLAAGWRVVRSSARFLLGVAITGLAIGLFLGGSRAAAAVGVAVLIGAALLAVRVGNRGRHALLAVSLAIAIAAAVGGLGALKRQIEWGAQNYSLAQRDLIWARGLVAWQESPFFGVGMDNYGYFDDEALKRMLERRGVPYVTADYAKAPHGHNLYINTLVERGIAGLIVLLALLGAWAAWLWRHAPRRGREFDAAFWYAAASGWLVTVVIGFANTTLHHEHALLALLTLALAINSGDDGRDAPV